MESCLEWRRISVLVVLLIVLLRTVPGSAQTTTTVLPAVARCTQQALDQCNVSAPSVPAVPLTPDVITMFCGRASMYSDCLFAMNCVASDGAIFRFTRVAIGRAQALIYLCSNETLPALQADTQCPWFNVSQKEQSCLSSSFPNHWEMDSLSSVCMYYQSSYKCIKSWMTTVCNNVTVNTHLRNAYYAALPFVANLECSLDLNQATTTTPSSRRCTQQALDQCNVNAPSVPAVQLTPDVISMFCGRASMYNDCLMAMNCLASDGNIFRTTRAALGRAQALIYLCSNQTLTALQADTQCPWFNVSQKEQFCLSSSFLSHWEMDSLSSICMYYRNSYSCLKSWITTVPCSNVTVNTHLRNAYYAALPFVADSDCSLDLDQTITTTTTTSTTPTPPCSSMSLEQCKKLEPMLTPNPTRETLNQFCSNASLFVSCLDSMLMQCSPIGVGGIFWATYGLAQANAFLCSNSSRPVLSLGEQYCPLFNASQQVRTCYNQSFPSDWLSRSTSDICGYYNVLYQCLSNWTSTHCIPTIYSIVYQAVYTAAVWPTQENCSYINPVSPVCSQQSLNLCNKLEPFSSSSGILPRTAAEYDVFCGLALQYSMCLTNLDCSQNANLNWTKLYADTQAQADSLLCSSDEARYAILNDSTCASYAMLEAPRNCSAQFSRVTSGCSYYGLIASCVYLWTKEACPMSDRTADIISSYYFTSIFGNFTADGCGATASTTTTSVVESTTISVCLPSAVEQCKSLQPMLTPNPTLDVLNQFCNNATGFASCLEMQCTPLESDRRYWATVGLAQSYVMLCYNDSRPILAQQYCPLYNASQQTRTCFNSSFPGNWLNNSAADVCGYYKSLYQCMFNWTTANCLPTINSYLFEAVYIAAMASTQGICSFNALTPVCSQQSLGMCGKVEPHFPTNVSLPQTPEEFDRFCGLTMQYVSCLNALNCSVAESLLFQSRAQGYVLLCNYRQDLLQDNSCAAYAIYQSPLYCSSQFNRTVDGCSYYTKMMTCVYDWTKNVCSNNRTAEIIASYSFTSVFANYTADGCDVSPTSSTFTSVAVTSTTSVTPSTTPAGFSTQCTAAVLARCNALLPALPRDLNWTVAQFDNYCMSSSIHSQCLNTMNCAGSTDNNLYVNRTAALKVADSNQYLCMDNYQQCGQTADFIQSVFLQSWVCAVNAAAASYSSCYNSSFPPSLDGRNIQEICGFYNADFLCQFNAIMNACGEDVARIYIKFYIPQWQPIWLTYFCTIESPCCPPCPSISTGCRYGFEQTKYKCDVCNHCLADPCNSITCRSGQVCETIACDEMDDCTWQAQCMDVVTTPMSTVPPPTCAPSVPTLNQYLVSNFSRTVSSLLLCEGTSTILRCPLGQSLEILTVAWGRSDSRTCARDANSTALNLRVSTPNAVYSLMGACEGENECKLTADVMTFGDPRMGDLWTPIYLTAEYSCRKNNYSALQCEATGPLVLSCPGTRTLSIRSAMFGRQDWNITCPHPTAMNSSNCSSPSATFIAQAICDGMSECYLNPTAFVFGDPCPGTYKYLGVEYSCEECENAYGDDAMCLNLANQGYCYTQSTFMMTYCRKACTGCGTEPIECKNDPEYDSQCGAWATAGRCVSDPQFMFVYCRKTCLNCDSTTACSNKYMPGTTACDTLVNSSNCTSNPNWMLPNCTGSCFQCSTNIKCEDRATSCEYWALRGECKNNPGYMIPFCTKSCLACGDTDPVCANVLDDEECENRTRDGECATNPVMMYRSCWKSCLQCPGETRKCANAPNMDAWCEMMAYEGKCNATLLNTCYLSCTRCAPTPEIDDCFNIDMDADCEARRTAAGGCGANAELWSNCRKTCMGCATSPEFIGSVVGPGDSNDMTEDITYGASIIMPDAFTESGAATYFSAFFVNTTPVYLQIWREVADGSFSTVHSQNVLPVMNGSQTIALSSCIAVDTTMHIGFTTINGPTPIAASYNDVNLSKIMYVKQAVSSESFVEFKLPYAFSLAVGYMPGGTC